MKIIINLFERCDHREADKQRGFSKAYYRRHKKKVLLTVK